MGEFADYVRESDGMDTTIPSEVSSRDALYASVLNEQVTGQHFLDTFTEFKDTIQRGEDIKPLVSDLTLKAYSPLTEEVIKTELMNPELDDAGRKQLLKAVVNGMPLPKLTDTFHSAVAQRGVTLSDVATVADSESADYRLETYAERMDHLAEKQRILNGLVAGLGNPSLLSTTATMASQLLPAEESYAMWDILSRSQYWGDIFDKHLSENTLDATITIGDLKSRVIQHMATLPVEEATQAAQELATAISNAGIGDYQKYVIGRELLEVDHYGYWSNVVDNAVGILDAASIGMLVAPPAAAAVKAGAETVGLLKPISKAIGSESKAKQAVLRS